MTAAGAGRRSWRAPEAPRDQNESAFTPILRRLYEADPRVLYSVFVDTEGECIDYVSSLDPFEAKVAGAHALVLLNDLRERRQQLGAGAAYVLELATDTSELWARRVSEEYTVVVLMQLGVDRPLLQHALCTACREFRHEVGIELPIWERPATKGLKEGELNVTVRPAVGWGYAPSAFAQADEQLEITDVLGRWDEPSHQSTHVCFRVRTTDGREWTLVHDTATDRWSRTL
ncbi:MAG: hypothetical protein OXR73_36330 [Myxococcales bacterium]|nr:hypothetical protein [Myxococcales bacterium]